MATESINDWVVKVGFDSSEVEKGAKRVEKIMARLAKMQAKLGLGAKPALGGGAGGGGRGPASPKKPKGFQLADDKQLKIANTIDSVMRRAGRGLQKNSEEFKKLNREAGKLKSTIAGVSSRTGLERLNNQIRVLRENTTSASAAQRRMTASMKSQSFSANKLRASMKNLAASYVSVFAIIGAGKSFFETGSAFDSINSSLLAASGNAEQAGKDFEFIKDISLGLGIGLRDVAEGFAKIGAAGRASGLSTGEIQDTFEDISKTVRAFGLTQDRASLVFLGFQQILSKGVVSMQELRQQIGEQLPTAIPIAKKALKEMGSEFTSLDDAVKSGTLSAKEFVPVFSRLLREDVESSGALEASLNTITAARQRFTSTLQLLTISSFDVGAKKGVVFFFNQLAKATERLQPLFRLLGKAVGFFAKILGGMIRVASLVSAPFIVLIDLLTDMSGTFLFGTDKVNGFNDALFGLGRVLKLIAGLILLPLGAIERLLNKFEELRENFKDGSLMDVVSGVADAFSQTGVSMFDTLGLEKSAPFFGNKAPFAPSSTFGFGGGGSGGGGGGVVNSGNTLTLNVDATGNDAEGVADMVGGVLQDMFSGAEANN